MHAMQVMHNYANQIILKKEWKKKENDDSERKSVFLSCLSLVSGEFIYHSREQKEVYKDNSPYGYQGIFISRLISSS